MTKDLSYNDSDSDMKFHTYPEFRTGIVNLASLRLVH